MVLACFWHMRHVGTQHCWYSTCFIRCSEEEASGSKGETSVNIEHVYWTCWYFNGFSMCFSYEICGDTEMLIVIVLYCFLKRRHEGAKAIFLGAWQCEYFIGFNMLFTYETCGDIEMLILFWFYNVFLKRRHQGANAICLGGIYMLICHSF